MGHHPFRTLAPRIAHRSYPPRRQPWHSILQSTFREKKQRGMERAGASESETQCPVICMYGQAQVNPALAVVPMVVDTSRPPKVGCRTNRRYTCINERLPKKKNGGLSHVRGRRQATSTLLLCPTTEPVGMMYSTSTAQARQHTTDT